MKEQKQLSASAHTLKSTQFGIMVPPVLFLLINSTYGHLRAEQALGHGMTF